LEYPATKPPLSGAAWPWDLTLRPLLVTAVAVAALAVPVLLRRRCARRRSTASRRSPPAGDT